MDRDRYEALDVIGSGGMAIVWRARDTLLGRFVAIKRPNPAQQGSIPAARFAREARAAATVAHPNLVAVHDAGVDDIGPYLVMELVDGPSLTTADVASDRVARIGTEVASALAALHAAGVVHGDVKPGNILLSSDGAKLTDFGIARAADDTATLTQPGVVFGTPAYAAPETLSHADRSAAADVYSLAVTLHELLTGSRWNATSGSTQAMPTGAWADVLTPALSAQPADRPTAAALAASLSTLDAHSNQATPTTPMPVHPATNVQRVDADTHDNSRRIAVGVFAVATLLIALIAALVLRDRDDVTGVDPLGTTFPATAPASATLPPASTPPTTSSPTTASPTTAPQSTSGAPTTSPTGRSTSDVAAELVALIDGVPRAELKPKEANDINKRIEDVVRVASDDPGDADEKLRAAAEQIAKNLSDGVTRDRAQELLIDLANTLGLSEAAVTEGFASTERAD